MNAKEIALYQWLEVLTATGGALHEDCWQAAFCLERGYIRRTGDGLRLTAAGEVWYETRAAGIRFRCVNHLHDFAPKLAGSAALHCRWCGACYQVDCPECEALAEQPKPAPLPPLRKAVGYYRDANGDYFPKYEEEQPGEHHHGTVCSAGGDNPDAVGGTANVAGTAGAAVEGG